jgi:hypothetical protein
MIGSGLVGCSDRDRGGGVTVVPESLTIPVHDVTEPVFAEFEIRNQRDRALAIRDIQTGCGCSVASVERRSIPPGERAKFRVEARGPSAGTRDLTITVETDDPDSEILEFRLRLSGERPPPYVVRHSEAVQFGDLDGKEAIRTLFVNTREVAGAPPWITEASTGSPALGIDGGMTREVPLGGAAVARDYSFRVTLSPPDRVGWFRDEIILATSDGTTLPGVSIPVIARVQPAIVAVPPQLYASLAEGEVLPELTLLLQARNQATALRAELAEAVPGVEVEDLGSENGRCRFRVRIVDLDGTIDGMLRFETNVPELARLEVPILVRGPSS